MSIALLTMTGRLSGERILEALIIAKKDVVGVVVEKRSSLLLKRGIFHSIKDSITKHGYLFLWERVWIPIYGLDSGGQFLGWSLFQRPTIPTYPRRHFLNYSNSFIATVSRLAFATNFIRSGCSRLPIPMEGSLSCRDPSGIERPVIS